VCSGPQEHVTRRLWRTPSVVVEETRCRSGPSHHHPVISTPPSAGNPTATEHLPGRRVDLVAGRSAPHDRSWAVRVEAPHQVDSGTARRCRAVVVGETGGVRVPGHVEPVPGHMLAVGRRRQQPVPHRCDRRVVRWKRRSAKAAISRPGTIGRGGEVELYAAGWGGGRSASGGASAR